MDTGLRARRHGFELGGGTIAEGRMAADSIVEYFDPFENVLPGFLAGPIALMMHVFRFQRMEEAFHHGIVPAVPAPTHARRQAVFGEQCAVGGGGVLRPAVRMMHHAVRWSSVFHGHGECRRGQFLSQAAPHSPGNDPTRVEIKHDRQIEPALGGPDIRDVAGPHPVGCGHRKLTVEGVRHDRMPMRRIRGGPPLRDRLRADRIRAHEPSHTVLTDPLALGLKGRVDPGAAVGPSRLPRGCTRISATSRRFSAARRLSGRATQA